MGSTFRTNFAASGKIFAGQHRASESESAAKKNTRHVAIWRLPPNMLLVLYWCPCPSRQYGQKRLLLGEKNKTAGGAGTAETAEALGAAGTAETAEALEPLEPLEPAGPQELLEPLESLEPLPPRPLEPLRPLKPLEPLDGGCWGLRGCPWMLSVLSLAQVRVSPFPLVSCALLPWWKLAREIY